MILSSTQKTDDHLAPNRSGNIWTLALHQSADHNRPIDNVLHRNPVKTPSGYISHFTYISNTAFPTVMLSSLSLSTY